MRTHEQGNEAPANLLVPRQWAQDLHCALLGLGGGAAEALLKVANAPVMGART